MARAGGISIDLQAKGVAEFQAKIAKAKARLIELGTSADKAGKLSERWAKSARLAETRWSAFGKKMRKTNKAIGSTVATMHSAIAVAAGFAAAAGLTMFGKHAIKMASDFNETSNVIQAGFGQQAQSVEEWASRSAQAMGRSTQQMRDFAGSFQAMLSPMMGSAQAAGQMSTAMAGLAVDLGSFFNVADQDVLIALKSGLSGEIEPLKKFGIVMKEDALESFRLAHAIKVSYREMDEASKVSLRYAYILDKTQLAQGDAERTGYGFANTLKAVQGAFDDLATMIGQQGLPSMKDLLETMKRVLDVLKDVDTTSWWENLNAGIKTMADYALHAAEALMLIVFATKKVAQVTPGIREFDWDTDDTVRTIERLHELRAAIAEGTPMQELTNMIGMGAQSTVPEPLGQVAKSRVTIRLAPIEVRSDSNLLDPSKFKRSALEQSREDEASRKKDMTALEKTQIDAIRDQIKAGQNLDAEIVKLTSDVRELRSPFPEITAAATDVAEQFRMLDDLAAKSGTTVDGGTRGLLSEKGGKAIADVLNNISSLDQLGKAVSYASAEAERAGIAWSDVEKHLRAGPKTLDEAFSGRVGQVFDVISKAFGLGIGKTDRGTIVSELSKALATAITGGDIDGGMIGKLLGQMFGATGAGAGIIGQIFGKAATLGGGGAAAIAGPTGAAVGAGVSAAANMVIPVVKEAFQKAADVVVSLFKEIPGMISKMAGKLTGLVPEARFQEAANKAFDPVVVQASLVGIALAAFAGPLMIVGSILGTIFAPALLAIGAAALAILPSFLAGSIIVSAFAAVAAAGGILYVALVATAVGIYAMVVSIIGNIVTPLGMFSAAIVSLAMVISGAFSPAVLLASTAMLGMALVAGLAAGAFMGAIGLFSLTKETKSFQRFTAAFENSIDRIMRALEPFFANLMALPGLFDALVSVILPMANAFASNETAARVMFTVLKGVAIALGAFAYAVAFLVNVVLAGVASLAVALMSVVSGLTVAKDAILSLAGRDPTGMDVATKRFYDVLGDFVTTASTMSPNLNEMGEALRALTDLTYDEARTRGEILAKEKESAEQLTNVPEGFKTAALRFRSIVADDLSSGVYPGDSSGEGGRNIFIDTIIVAADTPGDFVDQIERQAERRSFQETGNTGQSSPWNNGR